MEINHIIMNKTYRGRSDDTDSLVGGHLVEFASEVLWDTFSNDSDGANLKSKSYP